MEFQMQQQQRQKSHKHGNNGEGGIVSATDLYKMQWRSLMRQKQQRGDEGQDHRGGTSSAIDTEGMDTGAAVGGGGMMQNMQALRARYMRSANAMQMNAMSMGMGMGSPMGMGMGLPMGMGMGMPMNTMNMGGMMGMGSAMGMGGMMGLPQGMRMNMGGMGVGVDMSALHANAMPGVPSEMHAHHSDAVSVTSQSSGGGSSSSAAAPPLLPSSSSSSSLGSTPSRAKESHFHRATALSRKMILESVGASLPRKRDDDAVADAADPQREEQQLSGTPPQPQGGGTKRRRDDQDEEEQECIPKPVEEPERAPQPPADQHKACPKEDNNNDDNDGDDDDDPDELHSLDIAKPKRRLSAYNLFFQHERARLLILSESDEFDPADVNPPRGLSVDAVRRLLDNNPYYTDRAKRRHRKSHGRVGFMDLVKRVSGTWKTLDGVSRASFEALAEEDQVRYKTEMKEYKLKLRRRKRLAAAVKLGRVATVTSKKTAKGGSAPRLTLLGAPRPSSMRAAKASSSSSSSQHQDQQVQAAKTALRALQSAAAAERNASSPSASGSGGKTPPKKRRKVSPEAVLEEALRVAEVTEPIPYCRWAEATAALSRAPPANRGSFGGFDATAEKFPW